MLQISSLEILQYIHLWKADKGKERMYNMTKCNFPSGDHVLKAFISSSSAKRSRSAPCSVPETKRVSSIGEILWKKKTASEYNWIFNFMWPVSLIHWPCVKYTSLLILVLDLYQTYLKNDAECTRQPRPDSRVSVCKIASRCLFVIPLFSSLQNVSISIVIAAFKLNFHQAPQAFISCCWS